VLVEVLLPVLIAPMKQEAMAQDILHLLVATIEVIRVMLLDSLLLDLIIMLQMILLPSQNMTIKVIREAMVNGIMMRDLVLRQTIRSLRLQMTLSSQQSIHLIQMWMGSTKSIAGQLVKLKLFLMVCLPH